jgi:DNA repair exonuclease SbcCD nuclease subunit
MKRTKFSLKSNKEWDFLLVGDMHIRSDIPLCWDERFKEEQNNALLAIYETSREHNISILQSGDLFHKPNPGFQSILLFDSFFPGAIKYFYTIPGNHDLPFQNIDRAKDSAYGLMAYLPMVYAHLKPTKIKRVHTSICFFPFGSNLSDCTPDPDVYNIAVAHIYVDTVKPKWGGEDHHTTKEIFNLFKGFDLIVTGDNHIPVIDEKNGQLLINPGSITRQTADQIDHRPRIYLFSIERKEYEIVYLPIGEGISREHIEGQEKREERISAFVESLSKTHDIHLSFEKNMERFLAQNKVPKNIKEKIYAAMEVDQYA